MTDPDLGDMMVMIGASPSDVEARAWLGEALNAIPAVLRAKSNQRPWGQRNGELDVVAAAATRLRVAYAKLDGATEASMKLALGDQKVEREGFLTLLSQIEQAARKGKVPVSKGRRRLEGHVEAVKLLAGFTIRFGGYAASEKAESRFDRFVRMAMRYATGEEINPERAIKEVRDSGYLDVIRERVAHGQTE